MVVARVAHFDPRCPVCSVGTPGIFTTGAVVPPPFPNPEYRARPKKDQSSQGGQHGHTWYHGTHFSPEEDDPDEEDPVVQEAGGRLRTPGWSGEPGSRADEHWNTDLGVHFTSLHHVAKDFFAKPQSGDIDSRVAHSTLHMQNPKRFDSEHDMTHDAIDWAQKSGLHYLPQHPRAHEEFENGHYGGVADHDRSGTWDEVNPASMPKMREQREAVSHIDRHGPSWEEGDPDEEDKERYLASHPRRATVTEGYRQHLQSQGHDGVVYGNEHEGPKGHASAIAFPETPVAIHKWEWLNPDHGRPADAQESAEKMRSAPSNRQLKLFGSVPVPQGYHREYPETWGEDYHRYAQENPHGAAVGQAQEHMRTASPTWGMQMPDEESATSTARFMLGNAGHPRADTADVMHHPDPEKGTSNTFRRSDGDVGAVLHPDRFDYGTMAHELAHLTHQHELGVVSGRGLSDEELHGPGFMQHYRRMADLVSRGAGDELHGQYQEALRRVRGKTAAKTAASDWNFEHFHTEGQHWRSFGGPAENPRQHALDYKVRPEGTVEFPQKPGSMNEYYERKSGPEAHARMRQNALEHHDTTEHDPSTEKPAEPPKQQRRTYYHGTTVPDVTHILPATHHGQGVVFRNVTSPEHAYASTKLDDAWNYAQKAVDFKGGRPRVYQVRPIGGHKNVEKDPMHDEQGRLRGNNESDFRSKHGFEVVREMKPSKHVRDSYTDEEWGDD